MIIEERHVTLVIMEASRLTERGCFIRPLSHPDRLSNIALKFPLFYIPGLPEICGSRKIF